MRKNFCDKCHKEINDDPYICNLDGVEFDVCPDCLKKVTEFITGRKYKLPIKREAGSDKAFRK
jgi:ribosome-binding protein aMBF1 (putative translation factor)